jgi:hypothetical protein
MSALAVSVTVIPGGCGCPRPDGTVRMRLVSGDLHEEFCNTSR